MSIRRYSSPFSLSMWLIPLKSEIFHNLLLIRCLWSLFRTLCIILHSPWASSSTTTSELWIAAPSSGTHIEYDISSNPTRLSLYPPGRQYFLYSGGRLWTYALLTMILNVLQSVEILNIWYKHSLPFPLVPIWSLIQHKNRHLSCVLPGRLRHPPIF